MTAERLYELLPGVYRRRDAQQGSQLKALLAIVQEQVDILGADIDQLYENWFIETCQPWVTPYLGDLVGYRLLPGSDETLRTASQAAQRLLATIAGRRDVAHTVANRRRKGTLALLEDLGRDVAGWPTRAVEFRTLIGVNQAVRLHGRDPRTDRRRLSRGCLVDLHAGDALDRLDGPFDTLAHLVDVRRINSMRSQGRHNIPEVGLHVWRLRPYPITRAPAYCDDRDRTHFTFSILGNNTPLTTKPIDEPSPNHIADETNVPAFIRRRAFADRTAHYYGPNKSLCIYRDGGGPVPLSEIVSANLAEWGYRPRKGQVAIDPVLGRIAFPLRDAPEAGIWVDYYHGFSDNIGGGEYHRPLDLEDPTTRYTVGSSAGDDFSKIMDAVRHWKAAKAKDAKRRAAVIELTDSTVYQERLEFELDRGDQLTLRAAQDKRPVLRLLDWHSNRPDALRIIGTGNGTPEASLPTVVFDGLLITGRSVRVSGPVGQFVLRHSTLVPGWSLDQHCHPQHENEASIELSDNSTCLQVERSILGTILVNVDRTSREPNQIWLTDSILDAAGKSLAAVTGPDSQHAYAVFSARRTTVLGHVFAHSIDLVENSIVDGRMQIAHRQAGCVRFCWLHPDSRTPARFHCEPGRRSDRARLTPCFTSKRYGTPGYAQLAPSCPEQIRRGANDGSEMGAFHDLFQPQREDNLKLRLDEYTPAGTHANILIVT